MSSPEPCSVAAIVDPHEPLESVLKRSPSENLVTPEKQTVPLLPLKRTSSAALEEEEQNKENEPPEEDEERRQLDPRKLDIEGKVLFGDEHSKEDSEGEEVPCTQPYPPEQDD